MDSLNTLEDKRRRRTIREEEEMYMYTQFGGTTELDMLDIEAREAREARRADTIPLLSHNSSSSSSSSNSNSNFSDDFFIQEKKVKPVTTVSLQNQVRALKAENLRLKEKCSQYLETIQGFLKKEPTLSEHI
jgi:hypothetical protein